MVEMRHSEFQAGASCLDCSHVFFSYAKRGALVLDDLTLRIPPGFTALVGANGAGKSTILKIIASLLTPARGGISVDGVKYEGATKTKYREKIGWLPQDVPVIPRFTALDSVEYYGWLGGQTDAQARKQAPQALAAVGLLDMSNQHMSSLSGGQLRRLGIAQVLVRQTPWMLLDEPTAGLDPLQKHSLVELLCSLKGRLNCVISTHDFEYFAMLYDYAVVVEHGRVLWQGSAQEYLELGNGAGDGDGGAFQAYVKLAGSGRP